MDFPMVGNGATSSKRWLESKVAQDFSTMGPVLSVP